MSVVCALEAARGPEAEAGAHERPEVEGSGPNREPFSDLLLVAEVDTPESSATQYVRESPLDLLPSLTQQPLAPPAPDPSTVGIRRLLRVPVPLPAATTPIGLAHIVP